MYTLPQVANVCKRMIPSIYRQCDIYQDQHSDQFALTVTVKSRSITWPDHQTSQVPSYVLGLYPDDDGEIYLICDMPLKSHLYEAMLDSYKAANQHVNLGTKIQLGPAASLRIPIKTILDIPSAILMFDSLIRMLVAPEKTE